MKLILFIFSIILSLNLIAQGDWKDINPPVNVVNYGSTNFKYHVDNEGRLNCVFIYNDGSNDILQVDQYNNLSATWSNLYFETLSLGSGELKSDKDQQGNLVFSFVSNQENSPKVNVYSIAGNSVTQKFVADFTNYSSHANCGFRTFNSTEFYWFFPDNSGINYRIGYWQTATSTINDFVIGQFTGMDMQDFHLQLLGDTLWFASGDVNSDRLQLMKSHKTDINFLTHDGTSLGELYNGMHPVKLSTAAIISNRFDKLSVMSIDTTGNRVEIQFTNGVKSNKPISGDYYSNSHKYSSSNSLNEAYLLTNFGQSLDFSGSNTKVLEKDYATNTWEVVGLPGNQLFEVNQLSSANFDVFKNSESERISAAYSYFSSSKIKLLNEAPFIDSLVLTPRSTLCPHSSQVQLFSKFTLWDVNGDMLKITDISSSNQTVLADSNINYYSSFQSGKTQHFEVNSYQATAGTTTLTFYVTDGFDTISFTKDLTFTTYSINSVTNGTNCGNGQVSISANSSTGSGDFFWFDLPTGGSQLSVGASYITPMITSTTTYYVEATDNGCFANRVPVTAQIFPLPNVDAGAQLTICLNSQAVLSATGALTYAWTNGVVDGVPFSPTFNDTYFVTGTDANGCENTDQVNIIVNPLPTVDAGFDQTYCGNTSITLAGTGAQSYMWSDGLIDNVPFSISNTTTFTLTGTDANGCVATDQIVVTINPIPTVFAGNDTTLCETATISLFGSGADSYNWDNSVFNGASFAPPVGSTTYTVTGTDLNGCTSTDQITVTVNALPTINAGADFTICQNATISLSGSGGVNYSWDNGVSDGISFVPASSGSYSVIGTDANGCQNTDQVDVIVNNLPNVVANTSQTICVGASITLFGSGASSYTWNNGVTDNASFIPSATSTYVLEGTDILGCINRDTILVTVNPLPLVFAGNDTTLCENSSFTLAGSGANGYSWDNSVFDNSPFNPPVGTTIYTVTGTDLNGCENIDQITINVNALPIINAGSDLTVCQNDPVTLSGSGGVNYAWDNAVNDGISFNPTLTRTYTVIGTDANGCQNSDQVDINVNALPSVSAGFDITVCENDMVTNSAFGALTYSWDNGVTDNVPFMATPGVIAYTVSGTDANGCVGTDSKVVTVNALPNINAGVDQFVCEGALVTLTSTGAISLDWDNGAFENSPFFSPVGTVTYTVTGSDANGCTNSDQVDVTVYALPMVDAGADIAVCENAQVTLTGAGATTYVWDNGATDGVSFIPVASGTYTLTGTDANGCENTDQMELIVNTLPTIDAGVDITVCSGLSIVLAATGATSYVWDNGGVQNESFIPSVSTLYTVVGTDDNGCENSDQVDVTVNVLPTVNAGNDISVCQNETITLAGTGTAVSYAWDNGVTDNVGFPAVSTTTFSVLGTDVNGCQASDEVIVTVNFAPGITSNSPVEICENDVVNVSLSTGASIIRWFDVMTGGNLLFEGRDYNPTLTTNTTYYVEASDGICTSMRIPVDVIVNSRPQVQISTVNTDCGTSNGTASATISQGTAPFTYYWSSGDQNTLNISNLASGIYYFNVEDAKACKTIAAAEIFPTNVSIDGTSTDVSCFGGNNGAITTSVNGVTETFSYLWSNGYQSADISNLTAGTYELTIRTNSGCDFSKTFIVSEAPKLELEVSQIQPGCGNSDGELSVSSISGGTPTYTYNWSAGGTTNTLSNIPFGVYTLTITDANNCISDHVYYLSESNSAGIFGTVIPASCNTSNGSIDALLTPQIGDVVTDISWSNGETTEDITDLAVGNYVCTATTSNLCKSIRGWNIRTQKPLTQEICIVSVDSTTTTNLVVWEKAQTSGVSHYNIYRETNTADEYLLIDTVQYTNLSVFNDVIASPVARSWRYKIAAVDLCGTESDLSFPHKTLHLNTFDLGQNQVKVTWDQYEGNAFSSYVLWRFTDAAGWEEVASLPTNSLSFTDNIAINAPGLDYMVEISLDEPCTATLWRAQDFNRSRSNKEKSTFNPGSGTGEYSNNSIFEYAGEGVNIQLYPNPFDEELSIDFKGIPSLDVKLFGASGKLIQEFNYQEGVSKMNLSHLSNGVYYLKASKNNFETTIKIIKQ
jgi:hypothetical protein